MTHTSGWGARSSVTRGQALSTMVSPRGSGAKPIMDRFGSSFAARCAGVAAPSASSVSCGGVIRAQRLPISSASSRACGQVPSVWEMALSKVR